MIPQCIPCDCILTVKHILIERVDYAHICCKYYNTQNIGTVFQDVSPSLILGFLRECKFYNQFN